MYLPNIRYEPEKVRQEVMPMRGLNWSDRLQDGGLGDSLNISARRWPYLTTRLARGEQKGYSGVTALTAHGQLVAVKGKDLLLDGKKVGSVKAGEKRFAVVNTKLVIWPDMVCLDLESKTVTPMAAKLTLSEKSAFFTGDTLSADHRYKILRPEGEDRGDEDGFPDDDDGSYDPQDHSGEYLDKFYITYEDYRYGSLPKCKRCKAISRTAAGLAPEGEEEVNVTALRAGDIVLLNGEVSRVELNCRWGELGYGAQHKTCYAVITGRYAQVPGETWVFYDVYYCSLTNASLSKYFKAGDAVTISGAGENDKESAIIRSVTDTTLTFTSNSFTALGQTEGSVTIERKVPPLEFICESQNRLWGCEGHTIWASALGDPTNFYVYDGLSTDSYAVAVGTDGAFTGCVGYSEGVLFWKADCLHKVLGTYPANYELHTYGVPGVQAGSDKSQVVLNDVLYYLAERGVYAYSGGIPSLISACFGERRLAQGVGGSDGERYFLSAKEASKTHLLVYEPEKGLWLREDETRARDFARLGNRLYLAGDDGKVWLVDGGGEDPEQEWMALFTPFYETSQGRKRYTKLLLRLELPKGSWVIAEARHDKGAWRECGKAIGRTRDVIALRIPMNRCDQLELRLRGKGPCAVLDVVREFTVGSER